MPTDAGWAELRAGRWEAARAAFARAGETPAALEGLSWAAWWLDDADAVFAAREHAYRLYRADGNAAGAARMATWLAADELDFHGAFSVADGWLQRARRLLDTVEPGPDHGWLAFHEGFVAHAAGDGALATERAAAAADAGRRFGVPDLEMLGLALEGASLVARADVTAGMRCLGEATTAALAGEATIPISSAWTFCFLVSACTAVHDYDRAAEWCDRIDEFAERYGSRYMLGFCRAEYGAVELWRGHWAEAERLLAEAVEAFERSRPAYVSGPLAGLAELRRRQGRTDEAEALLERAGTARAAQLCRARLALDGGSPARAAELAGQLRRREPGPDLAAVLELLARAAIARTDLDGAAGAVAELRELTRSIPSRPLQATAELLDGMLAAARGDHAKAQPLLEDAVDGFEQSGGRYEAAQARAELAAALAALGDDDGAAREASVATRALRELGTPGGPAGEVTTREREVLALLAEGLTNRQIAARLVLSEHTVHRHVTNILRKLGLPSRAAAAAHAVRSGL